MRKFLIPILLLMLELTSCYKNNKEQSPLPHKLLSEQQMIEILTEIQLAEGRTVLQREVNKDVGYSGSKTTLEIYNTYEITPAQLVENMNYYQDRTEVMIKIYDGVLANLSQLQAEVKVRKEQELKADKIKKDSLQVFDNQKIRILPSGIKKVDYLTPNLTISDYFENMATRDSVSIPLSSW
ncbi:MAG: hypothetical protein CVT99_08155 [Bacteroidetes bacterium HGW-Bacteroidetes-16]|jgi:hypothetical protein|nr:MAG: hypothetical protein CVT99_08155 [Bacteroidetes bacterium HGW-Bacteroidetes-16]